MSKRTQEDAGVDRVTAKSKPMMNLRSYGNQNPWSTIAEKEEGPGRPDVGSDRKTASDYYYHEQFIDNFSSASYSKWDDNHAWSSQE